MKQMIYRRLHSTNTSVGGYAVTACAENISAMQRSEAQKYARVPMLSDESVEWKASFYRQYRLNDGTLVVNCGFYDPHGRRGSAVVHTAMTENEQERERYLDRLPAASGYFGAVRAAYDESGVMEIEKGDMIVSLDDYFAGAPVRREDALAIIRSELGSEETVTEMFTALMDVASINPRMIVVFMDAQDVIEVGERGRRLAEALLSCLPEPIAAAIGYMSPAVDDGENATFGLRFACRSGFRFGGAQSQAYTFDLPEGKVVRPRAADEAAKEYAAELAALVMRGDDAAFARVRELRAMMADSSCMKQSERLRGKPGLTVPAKMAIRYALVTRPDRLQSAEKRLVLDWRGEMIDEAIGNPKGFSPFAFWSRVDSWTLNVALPDLWANQDQWRNGGEFYAPERVLRVFEDSHRLHLNRRPEAEGYKSFVEARLAEDRLYPRDRQKMCDDLLRYFAMCADTAAARGADAIQGMLYFGPVENWVRTVWLGAARTFRRQNMFPAVEKLCNAGVLESDKVRAYVEAYSELIFEFSEKLYVEKESRFHADVVQAVARNTPERMKASMICDLRNKNPYASAGAEAVWQWYRKLLPLVPALEDIFLSLNRQNLENALARASVESIPALVDELRGGERGMIACAGRLDAGLNAREMIESRIVALSRNAGVGMYYPDHVQLGEAVCALLSRYDGDRWMAQHQILRDVSRMNPAQLTMDDFDHFVGILRSGAYPAVSARVREILDHGMMRAGQSDAEASMESLLIGLAMLTLSDSQNAGLCWNPEHAVNRLERLGVREQKMAAYCKKQADEDAVDGVGYLADVMLSYLRTPEKKRTGEPAAYPRPWRPEGAGRRAPLAGLPVAVPIAGIAVFAGGLTASALGLLNYIGLM